MKRQQRTVGAVVRIDLGNGQFSFARILDKANYAFYDVITRDKDTGINAILDRPILFILSVYNDVVTKGLWEKVGYAPLENALKILPKKYIQDKHTGKVELYDTNTGIITPSSLDQVAGLECAAVWESNHVEERIRDHYANRPNVWVAQLSIK